MRWLLLTLVGCAYGIPVPTETPQPTKYYKRPPEEKPDRPVLSNWNSFARRGIIQVKLYQGSTTEGQKRMALDIATAACGTEFVVIDVEEPFNQFYYWTFSCPE